MSVCLDVRCECGRVPASPAVENAHSACTVVAGMQRQWHTNFAILWNLAPFTFHLSVGLQSRSGGSSVRKFWISVSVPVSDCCLLYVDQRSLIACGVAAWLASAVNPSSISLAFSANLCVAVRKLIYVCSTVVHELKCPHIHPSIILKCYSELFYQDCFQLYMHGTNTSLGNSNA